MKIKVIGPVVIAAAATGIAAYMLTQKPSAQKVSEGESSAAVVSVPAIAEQQTPEAPNTSNIQAPSSAAVESDENDIFAAQDDNPNYETFHNRYQDIVARRAGREFDPDALYEAMQQPSAWEAMDEVPNDFNLSEAEINDGRSFIKFSEMKLESLSRGDTLDISIGNDDIDFVATITDVQSEGDGDSVTWYGTSNTPDSTDTIMITQGDGMTVGGIFTDQGLYQLEAKNGHGYIVSNATLFRHGEDQQIIVPPELVENPPNEYVELEAETFGVVPTHDH